MTRLVQTEQDKWLRDAERDLDGEPLTQSERTALAKEIQNKSRIARRALKAIENQIVLDETEQLQMLTESGLTRADAERFRTWQPPYITPRGRSPHSAARRRAALISVEVRKEKYGTAAPRTRLQLADREHVEQVAPGDHEQTAEQPESQGSVRGSE